MTERLERPLVSVLVASYNHEKFIGNAVTSILRQSCSDLELIIVDDGSQDDTPRLISALQDPRIRFRLLEYNRGACEAINIALRMSTGKFVAICNSDDEWKRDKIVRQLAILDQSPRITAVFSDVDWIDEKGNKLGPFQLPGFFDVFHQRNASRWTWLRNLLENGNCLCHPSILIRRETYDRVGLYDNRFRQLPDLDMWTRVLEHFDIFVMPERLISFRIHDRNTSNPSPETSRRDMNERRLILQQVMSRMSQDTFIRAFGSRQICIADELDLKIDQALYLLNHQGRFATMFRQCGLDMLFVLMADAEALRRLDQNFGITPIKFHGEMGLSSPWLQPQHNMPPDASALLGIRSQEMAKVLAARLRLRAAAAVRRFFYRD